MLINRNTEDFAGFKFYREKGNNEFIKMIEDIDFNGRFGEKYLDSKLTVLSRIILQDVNLESNAIVYGRILLYGIEKGLNRNNNDTILCKACKKLGYKTDDYSFMNDIKKNKDKIKNMRDIMMELANPEIDYDDFKKEI